MYFPISPKTVSLLSHHSMPFAVETLGHQLQPQTLREINPKSKSVAPGVGIFPPRFRTQISKRNKLGKQHGIWIMMKEPYCIWGHPTIHPADILGCLLMVRCLEHTHTYTQLNKTNTVLKELIIWREDFTG